MPMPEKYVLIGFTSFPGREMKLIAGPEDRKAIEAIAEEFVDLTEEERDVHSICSLVMLEAAETWDVEEDEEEDDEDEEDGEPKEE